MTEIASTTETTSETKVAETKTDLVSVFRHEWGLYDKEAATPIVVDGKEQSRWEVIESWDISSAKRASQLTGLIWTKLAETYAYPESRIAAIRLHVNKHAMQSTWITVDLVCQRGQR